MNQHIIFSFRFTKKFHMKTKTTFAFLGLFIMATFSVRAQLQYEINQQGGNDCPGSGVTLTVNPLVSVTTATPTGIGAGFASSGGNVVYSGGNPVVQRGVCWSTFAFPTIFGDFSSNGTGSGSFNSAISGLSPNTLYYVRAYAVTSAGTFYGNELTFTTTSSVPVPSTCGASNIMNPLVSYRSMMDQDGNTYKTVVIGNQEWMAENLIASHYRNGALIPIETNTSAWQGLSTGSSCWYSNDSSGVHCPYGKLYNWYAVSDPRNLCPSGWHIPTDAEWTQLENFLGGAGIAGGKLKSTGTQYWLAPNAGANNSTGYSGLPGGLRLNDGLFFDFTTYGYWWSSTQYDNSNAWFRVLGYGGSGVGRFQFNYSSKNLGLSVRCLKDQ